MDLTTLRYFVVTAEELHITNAAKRLFISQQTLSEHIKRLEKYCNTPLFQRKPSLQLTPAGQCVQGYAIRMLELERQMISELSDRQKGLSAKIVIGLSRNRARLFFSDAWREFQRLYPNVDVEIIEDSAAALHKMLLSGRIDVYIGLDHFSDQSIVKRPLSEEIFYFIVGKVMFKDYYSEKAKEYLRSFSTGMDLTKLAPFPLLMFRKGNYFRSVLDRVFSQINYRPRITFESNDHEMIYSLCAAGLGAGFVSEFYLPNIRRSRDDIYIFPLRQEEFKTHVILATRSNFYTPAYARDFFDIIQERYQAIKIMGNDSSFYFDAHASAKLTFSKNECS